MFLERFLRISDGNETLFGRKTLLPRSSAYSFAVVTLKRVISETPRKVQNHDCPGISDP